MAQECAWSPPLAATLIHPPVVTGAGRATNGGSAAAWPNLLSPQHQSVCRSSATHVWLLPADRDSKLVEATHWPCLQTSVGDAQTLHITPPRPHELCWVPGKQRMPSQQPSRQHAASVQTAASPHAPPSQVPPLVRRSSLARSTLSEHPTSAAHSATPSHNKLLNLPNTRHAIYYPAAPRATAQRRTARAARAVWRFW